METTVEILNKIANKLGDENADQYTTVAQALGSIANALGNADPDKIQTVPEALQEILAVAGGGGGSAIKDKKLTITVENSTDSTDDLFVRNFLTAYSGIIMAVDDSFYDTKILGVGEKTTVECYYSSSMPEYVCSYGGSDYNVTASGATNSDVYELDNGKWAIEVFNFLEDASITLNVVTGGK